MTEKLYYIDSHLFEFDAKVISCSKANDKTDCYSVVLDRTAFFPEGGGQKADTGFIGTARVLDVQETESDIIHFTDSALDTGTVSCNIDSEQRLRRMQNHSGEHIVSGLVYRAYGFNNVGFHMGDGFMTIDFSGELSWDELEKIELEANIAVRSNLPVTASFPTDKELGEIEYRSKLDLTENVRIVEIKGIDRCACCAPHVSHTGEIGMIKILSCERHRGGVRVTLTCGLDALDDYRVRQKSATEISCLLSAKRNEIVSAVERLSAERDSLRYSLANLELEAVQQTAGLYPPMTEGNITIFKNYSEPACRELVNLLVNKCDGIVSVFFGKDGAYRYIMGSSSIDMRRKAGEINSAINGRGGGKSGMITGTSCASEKEIIDYFNK